jgi:hypothetical protein
MFTRLLAIASLSVAMTCFASAADKTWEQATVITWSPRVPLVTPDAVVLESQSQILYLIRGEKTLGGPSIDRSHPLFLRVNSTIRFFRDGKSVVFIDSAETEQHFQLQQAVPK